MSFILNLADRMTGNPPMEPTPEEKAQTKLDQAMADLARATALRQSLPYNARNQAVLTQRKQAVAQEDQARKAVKDAEQAVRTATNTRVRNAYLAKLEERKAQEAQEQAARRDAASAQVEQRAKTEYKPSYLQAGGKSDQFEKDWTERIWPSLLQQRTEALTNQRRELAQQRYGL